jgi:hypothetical protein
LQLQPEAESASIFDFCIHVIFAAQQRNSRLHCWRQLRLQLTCCIFARCHDLHAQAHSLLGDIWQHLATVPVLWGEADLLILFHMLKPSVSAAAKGIWSMSKLMMQVDLSHFSLRVSKIMSLSLSLSASETRWQRMQSWHAAQRGISCSFAKVRRKSSDCLLVSIASEQGLNFHHHPPKELNPPLKNISETNVPLKNISETNIAPFPPPPQ